MHTINQMCVKPIGSVTEEVTLGVYQNCDKNTETWSWTKNKSLQYKKEMCLGPKSKRVHPNNSEELVLSYDCDQPQNRLRFIQDTGPGWYLYMGGSTKSGVKKARYISPVITKANSCLQFYFHLYGKNVRLKVYVKSGEKVLYPEHRYREYPKSYRKYPKREWYKAMMAIKNQSAAYQSRIHLNLCWLKR
ncbi:MAM and LDL-receptor class A domain-containing protein 1-like [Dendronephthya gigantea]|uniref:MAM and LDL-receptor class A domain-containing protein 1-like n=1 Tax=Dendronephthya gigantea TaxID=151771 RepID=UPI0010696759|nr:MAM and LDL-receptor class A domain-containing protein 1-like [Dendronephthya gigantea]